MLCVLSSSYNIWSLMFLLILYQHGKCVIMLQCTHTKDFPPLSLTDKYISLGKRVVHQGFTLQGWTSRAYLDEVPCHPKIIPLFVRKIFVSSQVVRIFLAIYLSIIKNMMMGKSILVIKAQSSKHESYHIMYREIYKHLIKFINKLLICIYKEYIHYEF